MRSTAFLRGLLIASAGFFPASQSAAQPADSRPHFYEKVQVVCVGIDNYASPGTQLNEAVSDAQALAAVLDRRFAFGPAKMLLDDKATKQAIMDTLEEIDRQAKPPEVLILYFACHGVVFEYAEPGNPAPMRVGFLVPHDARVQLNDTSDPRQWMEQAINMRTLVDRIERLRCTHVVLIADTCCSGFLTKRGLESREIVALLSEPSRTILAATTQREAARDGVFTKELVTILERGARDSEPLSVSDVWQKLRKEVPQKARVKMTPQMSHVGAGDGEFVFIPRTVSPKAVALLKEAVAEVRTGAKIDPSKLGLFRGVLDRRQELVGGRSTLADVLVALETLDYRYGEDADAEAKRWESIFKKLQHNASLGDIWAMAGLHLCYANGLGTEKAPADAYHWARQADQFVKPAGVGAFLLGRCYRFGIGVERNDTAARKLYEKSAEQGFLLGKFAVASLILAESADEASVARAMQHLEEASRAGLANATALLADVYALGKAGIKKDIPKAVELTQRAAQQGSASALTVLYGVYSRGAPELPPKDLKRAEAYLRQAAARGFAPAQLRLGCELFPVPDFPANLGLAVEKARGLALMEQAAKQNHAPALVVLSKIHVDPKYALLDHVKARAHLEKAVALDFAAALTQQGLWYLEGRAYRKDELKALECFKKSAAKKDALGCAQLAIMYEAGVGLDLPEKLRQSNRYHPYSHVALHWYVQALVNGGNPFAAGKLKRFRGDLNLESAGIPYDQPGYLWPRDVLARFKREYPDSAAEFEDRYPAPLRPRDADVVAVRVPRRQGRQVLVGEAAGSTRDAAMEAARKEALSQAVARLVGADGARKHDEAIATQVTALDGLIADSSEFIAEAKGAHRARVFASVDVKALTERLGKAGVPLAASSGGLFAKDLERNDALKQQIDVVKQWLTTANFAVHKAETAGAPKILSTEGDNTRVRVKVRYQLDEAAYHGLADSLLFVLDHMTPTRLDFPLAFSRDKGDSSLTPKAPSSGTGFGFGTRTISFWSYLPKEVRAAGYDRETETPMFLLAQVAATEQIGTWRTRVCYLVLPDPIAKPLLNPGGQAQVIRLSFRNRDDKEVAASTPKGEKSLPVLGNYKIAYEPGMPLGGAYDLCLTPFFGDNLFFWRPEATSDVDVDLPSDSLRDIHKITVELGPTPGAPAFQLVPSAKSRLAPEFPDTAARSAKEDGAPPGSNRPAPADQKTYDPSAAPVEIQSELTAKEPLDRLRKTPFKLFLVKMEAGKTYRVNMDSGSFDAFLRIEDENGKHLADDDDGGGDLNAQILFRPRATGTYRIIATTYMTATGDFSLRVRLK
jgi:TPR repeat protein